MSDANNPAQIITYRTGSFPSFDEMRASTGLTRLAHVRWWKPVPLTRRVENKEIPGGAVSFHIIGRIYGREIVLSRNLSTPGGWMAVIDDQTPEMVEALKRKHCKYCKGELP